MKLPARDLTFIAEALGKRNPPPMRYLAALSRHPSEIVREGVVYGAAFALARSDDARTLLERIADSDSNEIVRDCAADALEARMLAEMDEAQEAARGHLDRRVDEHRESRRYARDDRP